MRVFYLFVFCYCIGDLVAHNEIAFEQLEPEQQQIHAKLYKQASIERNDHTRDGRNFLSAALRFKLSNGSSFISYIRNPFNGAFFFVSGEGEPSLLEQALQLHEKLKHGFDAPKLSNHVFHQTEQNMYRLEDSEMKLISALTSPEYETLMYTTLSLINLDMIESIECHIFTTRDMCPCCYQHMQNFLNAINTGEDESIFSIIKPYSEVPVTFFISSIVGFPPNKESINFISSTYQYCLSDSEAPPIQHKIENKQMHCIFLRKNPYTDIIVETANNMQCLRQLNRKFQEQLISITPQSDPVVKIYRRKHTKQSPIIWKESLIEKDFKKQRARQRSRLRAKKRGIFLLASA